MIVSFLLASGVLGACSGSAGSSLYDESDASTDSAGNLVSNTDAATGNGDAGSNADAAKMVDRRIDPFGPGYEWKYDVKVLGNYPACEAGVHSAKVIGTMSYNGKSGYRVQSLCANAGVSDYAVDGDKVEVRVLETGPWELALSPPVADGARWSNNYGSFIWSVLSDQMVDGKTYNECWKAKDRKGDSYTNYCRGIGPVRWYVVDEFGNGYDARRLSVTF